MATQGRQWVRCFKPWQFGPTGTFQFKGSRIVKRFERQGQQCITHAKGDNEFTKCTWSGFWKGAKVQKVFNKGNERCTLWKKEDKTRTVCWPRKQEIVKRYSNNGFNCIIYKAGPRQWSRCVFGKEKKFNTNFKWAPFNFKTARQSKQFARQGQKCTTFVNGQDQFTKCAWEGDMRGAQVVKRYTKGPNRCTIWKSGAVSKTVCWPWKTKILKKFVNKESRQCAIFQRANRRHMKCFGQAKIPVDIQYKWPRFSFESAKVIKKFERQGQHCTVYANGINEYTKCHWEGDFAGARVVKTFNQGTQRCQEFQKGLAKKTICWEFKKFINKKFVRNGRKCVLIRQGFRTFSKCFGGLTGDYAWGKFQIKGAKIQKRFERQGQQCTLYTRGQETFTKCEWKGAFAGARVVKRYNKGPNRCTVWRKGTINRETCWNNRLFTVKKFTENGKQCTLYKRLHRQFIACEGGRPGAAKPAGGRQVLRRFVRNGQQCTTFKQGNRTVTRCNKKSGPIVGGPASINPNSPQSQLVRDAVEGVIQGMTNE
jgi:hypothetical protein